MRNRSSAPRPSSNKFLWFLTGVLITLFICGLTFLKKRVTIVNEGAQGEVITIANSRPALLAASHVNHEISTDAKTPNTPSVANDQYDFYTMLPKMQVKNAPAPAAAAVVPGPVSTPPPKPTKPLEVAEKSMLSPQQVQANPTSASSDTSTVAPSTLPAVSTSPTPSKFLVSAGSFNDAGSADAIKAQLLLAGIDQVMIKKTPQGQYQVLVGKTYSSKEDAKKIAEQVKSANVSAKVIVSS